MKLFKHLKPLQNIHIGYWSFFVVFMLISEQVPAPPIRVTVSNIDAIDLGVYSGSPVFSANDDICVFREAGACGGGCPYNVRSQRGAYTVTNGIDTAVFQVFYNDQAGVSGNQELTAGRPGLQGLSGIFTPVCSGVNGNFEIVFTSAELSPLSPGVYNGSFRSIFGLDSVRSRRARNVIDVSMTISDLVQITGLNNIPLTLSGLSYQGGDDFCVYRNGTGGNYSITASSANSAGPGLFTLSSGLNNTNYNVYFADSPGASAASTALTDSALSGGFIGTNVYNAACAAVNASVYIEAAAANFIFGGTYGDTLTLTIMPE